MDDGRHKLLGRKGLLELGSSAFSWDFGDQFSDHLTLHCYRAQQIWTLECRSARDASPWAMPIQRAVANGTVTAKSFSMTDKLFVILFLTYYSNFFSKHEDILPQKVYD